MDVIILSDHIPALKSRFTVIVLNKGSYFFVNFSVPTGLEDFADLEFKDGGSVLLTAKENLILVTEKVHNSLKGAKYLKFVRFERNPLDRYQLRYAEPKSFPKLRQVLMTSEERLYNAIGGLDNFIIYEDEIAVPSETTFGWIITRTDVGRYLPEDRNVAFFYVEHTKRGTAKILNEHEALDKVLDFKLPKSKVQAVFRVGIDAISKQVVEITNLCTSQKVEKIIISSQYPPRHAIIGSLFEF